MARHRKIRRPEDDEPGLNVSSLIDVCFLLLIYFLVTTQIVRKEQELSATIPGDKTEWPPATIAPLALEVAVGGLVSIRNESGLLEPLDSDPNSRELPLLDDRLKLYRDAALVSGQESVVQIQVEGEALQQRVTDVLNALAGARIKRITFLDQSDPF